MKSNMETNLITPFLNATSNVLSTMTATTLRFGEPEVVNHTIAFGEVSGVIALAGEEVTGNMLISFDRESILAIVSRMLMEKFECLNQEVLDAVGELTNMICGGAKRELSSQGIICDMARPMVMTGQNLVIHEMSKSEVLSVACTTPEGGFVLQANLEQNRTT